MRTNKEWRYIMQPHPTERERALMLDIHEQNEKILAALSKPKPKAKKPKRRSSGETTTA